MDAPALRFNEEPYHFNAVGNLLQVFREQGYVVLPDVFEAASVDPFREQIYELLKHSRELNRHGAPALPMETPHAAWPARAPRMRELLRRALWPNRDRVLPVLTHPSWVIQRAQPDAPEPEGWHRDGDHNPAQFGPVYYHYPIIVHVNMYFEDMTPAHGPTQVVPRSHRLPELSPFNGDPTAAFTCKKTDAVLWDQRMWHRGSHRRVEGYRVSAIFGFMAGNPSQYERSPAQKELYARAETEEERVLFGGTLK